ncbi:MAG: zinc ribbon domain-containing protein [Pseudomonadota bacterium]
MPIYGYKCQACGHTLDALQKMADDPLVDCPACGAPELKRQLSAPRFRLKGKGWYETDFKSDNQRNLAGEKESGGKADKADKADKSDKSADKKSDKATKTPSSGSAPSGSKASAA